jgi:hypothetical protein
VPQSLIDANVSSNERRKRLKRVSKAALDLAAWAAEGRSDYFIASQLSMLVRSFASAADTSPIFPDLAAVLDYLGGQIQSVVGRATKPEGTPPSRQAVEPVEETVLEHVASGSAQAASK